MRWGLLLGVLAGCGGASPFAGTWEGEWCSHPTRGVGWCSEAGDLAVTIGDAGELEAAGTTPQVAFFARGTLGEDGKAALACDPGSACWNVGAGSASGQLEQAAGRMRGTLQLASPTGEAMGTLALTLQRR